MQTFRERAQNRDTNFTAIVERAQACRNSDLIVATEPPEAIGTNDIIRYFDFFNPKEQLNPTTYVLNRCSGKPPDEFVWASTLKAALRS